MDESLMPQMAFQFLAIAMALAAFLPALVYSYVKELVDELEQSYEELKSVDRDEKASDSNKKEIRKKFSNVEKNIPRFVYVVDFIVTQSMALVIFSGFVGVTIYYYSLMTKHWIIFSAAVITEILCYLFFLRWSDQQIDIASKDVDVLERYWLTIEKNVAKKLEKIRGFKFYRDFWFASTILLVGIILSCSIYFYFFSQHGACFPLHFILGTLSLALILYATSWLIPLIDYKPLMGRVGLILIEINNRHPNKNKKEK